MPSTLRPALLADALPGVVDDVRRAVHGALGTRNWRVAVVRRVWSGSRVGVGTPQTFVLELDPPPLVDWTPKYRLGPGGAEEDGRAQLTEVSLRYTEEELDPPTDARTEVAYWVRPANGHGERERYMVLDGPPVPRVDEGSDWLVNLRTTVKMTAFDGVPSP